MAEGQRIVCGLNCSGEVGVDRLLVIVEKAETVEVDRIVAEGSQGRLAVVGRIDRGEGMSDSLGLLREGLHARSAM